MFHGKRTIIIAFSLAHIPFNTKTFNNSNGKKPYNYWRFDRKIGRNFNPLINKARWINDFKIKL